MVPGNGGGGVGLEHLITEHLITTPNFKHMMTYFKLTPFNARINYCDCNSAFKLLIKSLSVTILMKAAEIYFLVILFMATVCYALQSGSTF